MQVGIDLGSRSVKLIYGGREKQEQKVFDTAEFYRDFSGKGKGIDFGKLLGEIASSAFGETRNDVFITACGYGKVRLQESDNIKVISEIKAHAKGAITQTGLKDFLLLDMGGQDCKFIYVEKGAVKDFRTNDKCAASTGRYIENMAKVLGISTEQIGKYYEGPIELNSTCAIFGESELIGLIAEGKNIENIAAGVNHTIYKRMQSLLGAFGNMKNLALILSGGVANNTAIKKYFTSQSNYKIIDLTNPQFNGAIGCFYTQISMD